MVVTDVGGNRTCKKTVCRAFVLKPLYVGKPSVTWTFAHAQPYAAAFDSSGRLFVKIDRSKTAGEINVYAPPFRAGQKAAFVLHPGGPVRTPAFDPQGNLFGQLLETGGLIEFALLSTATARRRRRRSAAPKASNVLRMAGPASRLDRDSITRTSSRLSSRKPTHQIQNSHRRRLPRIHPGRACGSREL